MKEGFTDSLWVTLSSGLDPLFKDSLDNPECHSFTVQTGFKECVTAWEPRGTTLGGQGKEGINVVKIDLYKEILEKTFDLWEGDSGWP